MKKILATFLMFMMLLSFASCSSNGTQSSQDASPLSEEEISQLYADPNQFKGRSIEICGKIFNGPEKSGDGTYLQLWADPTNSDLNTIVYTEEDLTGIKTDDYVRVSGTVADAFEGENSFGATITAPQITAQSIEAISYIDAVSPTLKEFVPTDNSQDQLGYKITVSKVEFAEQETRVYLKIENAGSSEFHFYSFSAKAIQNSKQYEQEYNYNADYPEVQSDITVGAYTEGIIVFPKLEQTNFDLILEGHSDNWEENIAPYTFKFSIEK